ncbi:MAG: hypothetical protein WD512_19865 [Candidatus Paceibacterota bacterium]
MNFLKDYMRLGILLSGLICINWVLCGVEIWNLKEMDIDALTLIKKVPMHTVYKGDGFYAKIWISNTRPFQYGRDKYFYHIATSGYLDEVVPLKAVIINEKGQCYGYATEICETIQVDMNKIRTQGLNIVDSTSKMVAQLFSRMRKITIKDGICFNDLAPTNLGIRANKCYYFDLDGIWSLDLYKINYPNWQEALFYLGSQFIV